MASAIDVANYLAWLAESDEDNDLITHLRMQKFLYYTQGWSLGTTGEPLFDEEIIAYPNGPVVHRAHGELKRFGRDTIHADTCPGDMDNLTDDEMDLVARVYNTYKTHSASSLVSMTHNERPWREARGGVPDGMHSNNVISVESIKSYFSELADGQTK